MNKIKNLIIRMMRSLLHPSTPAALPVRIQQRPTWKHPIRK